MPTLAIAQISHFSPQRGQIGCDQVTNGTNCLSNPMNRRTRVALTGKLMGKLDICKRRLGMSKPCMPRVLNVNRILRTKPQLLYVPLGVPFLSRILNTK